MRAQCKSLYGFTLIEMIVVMAITGILGSMVIALIKGPVQGYLDSAQRAGMTDVADTAFHRIVHDLRLALPNSPRVINGGGGASCNGSTDVCYLEYLEMVAGGRYNTTSSPCFETASMITGGVSCLVTMGDLVDASANLVNGRGTIGASAVVEVCAASSVSCGYNYGVRITGVTNGANSADAISFASSVFPASSSSANHRFQIVNTPVTYACNPNTGYLTRYWNYAIQSVQPNSTAVAPLSTASSAVLATHVGNCSFAITSMVDASGQSAVLVTMPMIISEQGLGQSQSDKLTLQGAAYAGSESALYGSGGGSVP